MAETVFFLPPKAPRRPYSLPYPRPLAFPRDSTRNPQSTGPTTSRLREIALCGWGLLTSALDLGATELIGPLPDDSSDSERAFLHPGDISTS